MNLSATKDPTSATLELRLTMTEQHIQHMQGRVQSAIEDELVTTLLRELLPMARAHVDTSLDWPRIVKEVESAIIKRQIEIEARAVSQEPTP